MDTSLNNVYLITGIVLASLLIVSELLGWSKCEAKAITQLHRCLSCRPVNSDSGSVRVVVMEDVIESVATTWSE